MAPRSDWENPTSCLVTSPHSAHTIQSPCSFPWTVLCVLLSLFFHECVCVCLCVYVCVCVCLSPYYGGELVVSEECELLFHSSCVCVCVCVCMCVGGRGGVTQRSEVA